MAVSAGIAAVASAGLGAYGLVKQQQNTSKATEASGVQTAIAQQITNENNTYTAKSADIQNRAASEAAYTSAGYAASENALNIQASDLTYKGAVDSAAINKQILTGEQGIQDQRRQAMELDAHRQQLEIIRQGQRARASGLVSATAQGAQFGSGLQGGYGQTSGQTNTNLGGVRQNLGIGRNIFDLNAGITNNRIAYSDLTTELARAQADLTTQKSNLINNFAQMQADFQTRYAKEGADLTTSHSATAAGYQNRYSAAGGGLVTAQANASIGASYLSVAPQLFNFSQNVSKALDTGPSTANATANGGFSTPPLFQWFAGT